jgi:hypothetical protein
MVTFVPPVAVTNASTVPSPPSAIGRRTISAPGIAENMPRANASATPTAERLLLKESGAIIIFIFRKYLKSTQL